MVKQYKKSYNQYDIQKIEYLIRKHCTDLYIKVWEDETARDMGECDLCSIQANNLAGAITEADKYYNNISSSGCVEIVVTDKRDNEEIVIYHKENKYWGILFETLRLANNCEGHKLADAVYMQGIISKAKQAYAEKRLDDAGKYWHKIYDAMPNQAEPIDYKLHQNYMRQFTNEEVYGITDYLKKKAEAEYL